MTVAAYDDAAEAWAAGPARVYARLAEAMLDLSPVPVRDAAVLDVGAGTAVVAEAARRRGARRVIASDAAAGMLLQRPRGSRRCWAMPPAAVRRSLVRPGRRWVLPEPLPDPALALQEWRRVAGAVVASAFAPGPPHPAKVAVDTAMEARGFVTPDWYEQVKDASATIEHPEALAALVTAAGFGAERVTERPVDVGLDTPEDVVGWRFGMAHLAPWVNTLSRPDDGPRSGRAGCGGRPRPGGHRRTGGQWAVSSGYAWG